MSGSREDHLAREERNAAVERELVLGRRFPDWALTALFYRAVHLVDACLGSQSDHYSRNAAVNNTLSRGAAIDYHDLYDRSKTARYDANTTVTWDDYRLAQQLFDSLDADVRSRIQ